MKKILLLVIILILLLVIRNNISSIIRGLKNENTAASLKKELSMEEKRNLFLKERLFYVKTNQFIDEEAREKLGMVKVGEYIVIAPTTGPLRGETIVIDERPNWKKWLDLFL